MKINEMKIPIRTNTPCSVIFLWVKANFLLSSFYSSLIVLLALVYLLLKFLSMLYSKYSSNPSDAPRGSTIAVPSDNSKFNKIGKQSNAI